MTLYMLSVYGVEGQNPSPEDIEKAYADVDKFNRKIMDQGNWVFGGGLEEPSTATVVKEGKGDIITTDGPFAEAKEQLGGFWIIRAHDLDEALALAGEATVACQGPVEVRPFQADTEG